jgi:hypothetical protein
MLVLCGLNPLTGNIHAARSNAERLFRAAEIANLSLTPEPPEELSAAAQALVRPATDITYADGVAERVARDVDGYPYFIQWFGESLWEAADIQGLDVIGDELYEREQPGIQQSLDEEFFMPRYREARQGDQETLRGCRIARRRALHEGGLGCSDDALPRRGLHEPLAAHRQARRLSRRPRRLCVYSTHVRRLPSATVPPPPTR